MISSAKKYMAVLLVFVCVCMIFSPLTAYAGKVSDTVSPRELVTWN